MNDQTPQQPDTHTLPDAHARIAGESGGVATYETVPRLSDPALDAELSKEIDRHNEAMIDLLSRNRREEQ